MLPFEVTKISILRGAIKRDADRCHTPFANIFQFYEVRLRVGWFVDGSPIVKISILRSAIKSHSDFLNNEKVDSYFNSTKCD